MVIDVHNHFYPPEYLDALHAGDSIVKLTIDAEGNPCIHYPGDYNVAVRGHRDIAYRQSVLEQEGVDTQIITFTTPGTHVEPPDRAVRFTGDAAAVRPRGLRRRTESCRHEARHAGRDAVQQRERCRARRPALRATLCRSE